MTHFPDEHPFPLICLSETDSTNNYLNDLSNKETLAEFTTVITDFQTSGKGQRGNSWESQRGENLLFSTILYPGFLDIRKQFLLSQLISLSIKDELESITDGFSIKWPNDIYWKNKKICGILIENDLLGDRWAKSIAGIGINVNQEEFQSNAPNPVSLQQIMRKKFDKMLLLKNLISRAKSYYELLKQNNIETITTNYHQSLFRKDGFHPYKDCNGCFMARIDCIMPEGTLILEDDKGLKRSYAFKEVKYEGL